jgi:hypothetical protein
MVQLIGELLESGYWNCTLTKVVNNDKSWNLNKDNKSHDKLSLHTVLTSAQDKMTVISKASAMLYDLLMTSSQSKDQTNAHSTAGVVKLSVISSQW